MCLVSLSFVQQVFLFDVQGLPVLVLFGLGVLFVFFRPEFGRPG